MDLQSLTFPSCTVNIPLWPPELKAGSRSDLFQSIDEIAYAVSQLRAYGVSISITTQAVAGVDLPAPNVIKSVASVIREIDFAQIASMTSTSWQPRRWECFSEAHLRALKSARRQMQVLCISDALAAHPFNRNSIALVASFTQLKKLVLQTESMPPDHSSLTQLTCLEDISLMVSGHGNCAGLIHRQRHKLVHIRLSATSWAKASYHALAKVTALHTLVVNVYRLTTSSAEIIASLQRPPSIHVVLRNGSGPQRRVLQILSSGSAMTDLTLRECTSSMLEGLCTMPHLSSLSIAMSNINDANLHLQPCVTHLTLLNWGETADNGVSRMLTVLPASKCLSFEYEDSSRYHSNVECWPLSTQSLIAVTEARQLSFLGLKAVRDLSHDSISRLEYAFRAQQEVSLAAPKVHVALPKSHNLSFSGKGFFIDYTNPPVFCVWRSAKRKPTVAQHFTGKVGKLVRSWVQRKTPACAGACKQFVPQDMGHIVVAGVLAIHTFCITHLPQ